MLRGRSKITCPLPDSTSKYKTQSQSQEGVNKHNSKILLGQIYYFWFEKLGISDYFVVQNFPDYLST